MRILFNEDGYEVGDKVSPTEGTFFNCIMNAAVGGLINFKNPNRRKHRKSRPLPANTINIDALQEELIEDSVESLLDEVIDEITD